MTSTQEPQALLHEWDFLWSSYMRGVIAYREVTVFCANLSESDGEELWAAIQERRQRQFEETAWA